MAFSNGLQDGHLASVVLPQRHYQPGDLRILLSRTVDILCSERPISSSGELLLSFTMSTILGNALILAHIGRSPACNRQSICSCVLVPGRMSKNPL